MTSKRPDYFPLGLLISDRVWTEFGIPEILEGENDGGGKSSLDSLRLLAQRVNQAADQAPDQWKKVYAGDLSASGLLNDIFRYLIDLYCLEELPGSMQEAIHLSGRISGAPSVSKQIRGFVDHFPPAKIKLGAATPEDFLHLEQVPPPPPGVHDIPRESILLNLGSINPAMKSLKPLFDDRDLADETDFPKLVHDIEEYYRGKPPVPQLGETLFGALRAPMLACPDSLDGQLDYIYRNWAHFLPDHLTKRILLTRDVLREERKQRGHIQGTSQVLSRELLAGGGLGVYPEYERFSSDRNWMENVVLLAKSTYVWLDQLSREYHREIRRLDQIPDAELDKLATWGVTGLWLIGLWERSCASQWVKQRQGNVEALASAYSLYDYEIAADLGGHAALEQLRERAWNRGIRLASDMVPNHVGLYSRWVIEHPDWFVQLNHSPYPNYGFNSESLSADGRVGLYIEDGYWDHRDAAVVFKRVDFHTGETRFIYHGNDGTHMPWNDTAQLDYLKAEVREAVIQTILHVARQFSIIRFDAAMTLAKKHFQRLWYPPPGEGGDIPSRAERGLSREDFDRLMPQEFWREVVDRVATELPDTLLLAEAFWLMEGYFVRTLGMHRVYNSAFMNMLKMEDNAKYRSTVKNVLEFSPEILKRFVSFMNNPDEETAVAQFGKGDKYFGVCLMLVTMPGLPMIGHGQVEGFTEKYGMEYRKAYYDEHADLDLVRRHEAEIFPLMRKRYLFAGSANFAFYDFHTPEGHVDENVFAYSNRVGAEKALVLYNNAYPSTRGTVHMSTAINVGKQDNPSLIRRTLTEALGIRAEDGLYYVLHDHRPHLDYLVRSIDLRDRGIYAELGGYQYHVFLGFREVVDTDGSWWRLFERLGGRGVPNLDTAYREMILESFHAAVVAVLDAVLNRFVDEAEEDLSTLDQEVWLKNYLELFQTASREAVQLGLTREVILPESALLAPFFESVRERCRQLRAKEESDAATAATPDNEAVDPVATSIAPEPIRMSIWAGLCPLACFSNETESGALWFDDWLLYGKVFDLIAGYIGSSGEDVWREIQFLRATWKYANPWAQAAAQRPWEDLEGFWEDLGLSALMGVHEHQEILWFSKESYEGLVDVLRKGLALSAPLMEVPSPSEAIEEWAERMLEVGERSGYQVAQWRRLWAEE